eukprot:CAMPEP_0171086352 /NCGR_PEP_ID=MMETSP0766_2-20121228/19486_1 /TAXON_ID=439317 /ORGANISM="Gambierdiscus australes, Strain CAWD 149" /LENGTH=685 /DNA_ID=CAMNT_0011543991 /DNA_START=27 /DNA_END=2084 /DNA_ORIENTATION=+
MTLPLHAWSHLLLAAARSWASRVTSCASALRCMELGFGFMSMPDLFVSKLAVENFKPDMMVSVPDLGKTLPEAMAEPAAAGGPRKYIVRVGEHMPGALWPEFAPIWLGHKTSYISLFEPGTKDEVARSEVRLAFEETALSLRAKHVQAAADMLAALVDSGCQHKAGVQLGDKPAMTLDKAPLTISLDWSQEKVERYVRASLFPPHDPAVVVDPTSSEKYFIESVEQLHLFRAKVLQGETAKESGTARIYAADTHWYSNIGGSIVKMGDSNIHMPIKACDKKRKTLIPGAALDARKKLRMNEPLIGPNAGLYCSNVLNSGWIGVEGPYIKQFEKHLARICGCAAACAVQSGTAALYGAMKALGVSDPSHHVLVPSFTCAACADAIVHAGGRPIPIDCELDSYGLSLEAVRSALDQDKDAVGVVIAPCYGTPARDFNGILALCKDRGLWICEDACESYGAVKALDDGSRVPVGALATLSVVSVRSEKMIGVGEGGAILGNDVTLVARAKWWCSRAPCRGVGLWRVYEHDAVGQNFRLPEMLAAVGCAAAEMLPIMMERKRAIHDWYTGAIAARPGLGSVRLQKEASGDESVWWINAALLPEGMSGEEVGMRLMKDYPDIEIRPGFFPLNVMKIFKSKWSHPCPNAETLYKRLVCLPSSNQLLRTDIERICSALEDAMGAVTAGSSTK